MAIGSSYGSSGSLTFVSNTSSAGYLALSSQIIFQHGAGSSETYGAGYYGTFSSGTQSFTGGCQCQYSTQSEINTPVVTAATSGQMPAFGHLIVGGTSARSYFMAVPRSPFGQQLTIFCTASSTTNVQSVWASTDGSVTWDGTNQVVKFSSDSGAGNASIFAVAISSQRWNLIRYSTTTVTLSTSST